MAHLINEMIFLLLATACISALLGRFLCKSNERTILAEKKQCQTELTRIQKQRDEWEIRANHWQSKLEETNENLAEQTYAKSSLETQIEAAAKERENLLMEVKKNDIYKARLASVNQQLKTNQSQLKTLLKKFEHAQAKINQLSESNTTLEEKLVHLKQHFDDMLDKNKAFKQHCHSLRTSNEELKATENEYYQLKESFAELSQEHQKLIRQNAKLQANQKHLAEFKKLQNENKALHALRDEVTQLIEERDQLHEENQYLQNELTSISAAHDEQSEILQRLMSQRDDFLSRLHAVSSVVGAMSVGGGKENQE